jgi:mono/diheme cytochrome c family protein
MVLRAVPLLAVSLVLTACGKDSHGHPDSLSGKELFKLHCAGCHQPSGKGSFITGVPANKNTKLSTIQIYHKIKGRGSDKMPAFPKMSDAEASKIASYVKSL